VVVVRIIILVASGTGVASVRCKCTYYFGTSRLGAVPQMALQLRHRLCDCNHSPLCIFLSSWFKAFSLVASTDELSVRIGSKIDLQFSVLRREYFEVADGSKSYL